MKAETLVFTLVVLFVLREAWHFYQVNLLVNKLTSRGFYEYKLAESVGKPKPGEFVPPKLDESEDEDISGRVSG